VQPLLDCEVARLLAGTSGVQALDDPLALSHFGGKATTTSGLSPVGQRFDVSR
jgi:hypothetical protein